jgi:hypothetical protein
MKDRTLQRLATGGRGAVIFVGLILLAWLRG